MADLEADLDEEAALWAEQNQDDEAGDADTTGEASGNGEFKNYGGVVCRTSLISSVLTDEVAAASLSNSANLADSTSAAQITSDGDHADATVLASPAPATTHSRPTAIELPPASVTPAAAAAGDPVPLPNRASPDLAHDGPLTPRNTAGPFVFDGTGERGVPGLH